MNNVVKLIFDHCSESLRFKYLNLNFLNLLIILINYTYMQINYY